GRNDEERLDRRGRAQHVKSSSIRHCRASAATPVRPGASTRSQRRISDWIAVVCVGSTRKNQLFGRREVSIMSIHFTTMVAGIVRCVLGVMEILSARHAE